MKSDNNYHYFENLNYFDFDYDELDDSKDIVLANSINSIDILC